MSQHHVEGSIQHHVEGSIQHTWRVRSSTRGGFDPAPRGGLVLFAHKISCCCLDTADMGIHKIENHIEISENMSMKPNQRIMSRINLMQMQ